MREVEPEIALWEAVCRLAQDDLISDDSECASDALAWFLSDEREIGSFLFVADILGIDVESFRAGIQAVDLGELKRNLRSHSGKRPAAQPFEQAYDLGTNRWVSQQR